MVAGDDDGYRVFFHAYFERLHRYLLVLNAGNDEEAKDALQETMRRVVRHVHRFDDEAALWSWLTVLARSACFDGKRKQKRYLAFLDRFTRFAEKAYTPNCCDNIDETLNECLSSLQAEDRRLIELKYFDHLSVRDISRQLGSSEKVVESRLSRIRLKLRQTILAALNNEPR